MWYWSTKIYQGICNTAQNKHEKDSHSLPPTIRGDFWRPTGACVGMLRGRGNNILSNNSLINRLLMVHGSWLMAPLPPAFPPLIYCRVISKNTRTFPNHMSKIQFLQIWWSQFLTISESVSTNIFDFSELILDILVLGHLNNLKFRKSETLELYICENLQLWHFIFGTLSFESKVWWSMKMTGPNKYEDPFTCFFEILNLWSISARKHEMETWP